MSEAEKPARGFELLCEMATYEKELVVQFGKDNGFCRRNFENGKIRDITICGTELHSFSDDEINWSDFSDLESFLAYMNELSTLPEGLKNSKRTLKLVCVQNNHFRDIPKVLFSLSNLQHLNMHGNYLSAIPPRFSMFRHLERLYLGNNDLISLPNIFGNFPNLKEASFTANSLTRLPLSFSKLSKLENLDISYNAFIKFPEPLLNLKLKYLNIKRNKLQKLSPTQEENQKVYESTSTFFKQLTHVQIELNPISKHDLLEGKKGITGLLKVHFQELSTAIPSCSVRVVVLGESGAGKTSVVEAFTMRKHVIPTTEYGHRHTVGIDRHYYPVKVGDKVVLLHIWDHAGDDEYAMMNDLFITDNCLVWLVVNLHEYKPASMDDRKTYQKYIGKWLLKVMAHDLSPAVWIVCTHEDSEDNDVDIEKHIRDCTKKLCEEVRNTLKEVKNTSNHPSVPIFSVKDLEILFLTNNYSFKGHEMLKKKLQETLKKRLQSLSSNFESCPVFSNAWVGALDRLHKYAEEKLDANESPIILKNSEEFESLEIPGQGFLEYHHDIGEIFLLESPGKETIIILNLDWMINLLKEIYHREFEKGIERLRYSPECLIKKDVLRNAMSNREKYGKICGSILKELWKCVEFDSKVFDSIIDLFVKCNLTYQVPSDKSCSEPSYFFPHLKQGCFPEIDYKKYLGYAHITVVYTFACHVPEFFLQRLALEYWRDKENIYRRDIFKDGFMTEFDSGGVKLHVSLTSTDRAKTNAEEIKLFAVSTSKNLLDSELQRLWRMVPAILNSAHEILTRYWTIHGQNELSVDCPNCVLMKHSPSNYVCLVGFTKESLYSNYCCNHHLKCKLCGGKCSVHHLVPTPAVYDSLQISNNDGFVKNEKEFLARALCSEWECSEWEVCDGAYSLEQSVASSQ